MPPAGYRLSMAITPQWQDMNHYHADNSHMDIILFVMNHQYFMQISILILQYKNLSSAVLGNADRYFLIIYFNITKSDCE